MKLASFKAGSRTSYGAVTDGGIINLGRKLGSPVPLAAAAKVSLGCEQFATNPAPNTTSNQASRGG